MKQIILVFTFLISNWALSQNDSISKLDQIYNRRFELSKPAVLPDYPMFKGLQLNAIWECLITLDIFYRIKEEIDFNNERKQIHERLREISAILAQEGIYLYLTSGLDCYYNSKEKNKNFNNTKELYLCVGDCVTSAGYSDGEEVFNKATKEIQNKLAYQNSKF